MIFLTRFFIFSKNGTVGCCWGLKVPVFPETYVWSGCEGFRSMLYKLGGGDKGGGRVMLIYFHLLCSNWICFQRRYYIYLRNQKLKSKQSDSLKSTLEQEKKVKIFNPLIWKSFSCWNSCFGCILVWPNQHYTKTELYFLKTIIFF